MPTSTKEVKFPDLNLRSKDEGGEKKPKNEISLFTRAEKFAMLLNKSQPKTS